MLIDQLIEFLKDKLRNATMFGLFALLAIGIWWKLNDEGALVAGILFAGIAEQQAYRHHLSK